jgi:hypothetical protein
LPYTPEPKQPFGANATGHLALAFCDLIEKRVSGGLKMSGVAFYELAYSRLGSYGDPKMAEAVSKELRNLKLPGKSPAGKSIPLNPLVRAAIVDLLTQFLGPKGLEFGLEISPAADPSLFATPWRSRSRSQTRRESWHLTWIPPKPPGRI